MSVHRILPRLGAALAVTWVLSLGAVARADDAYTGPHQEAILEMTEYRFSPAEVALEAGVETRLTVVNKGTYLHEFEAPYLTDVQVNVTSGGLLVATIGLAEVEVPPGATVELTFTPERRGAFAILCDANEPVRHADQGMRGTLLVH